MENEATQDASEHPDFLEFVPDLFHKNWSNVMALTVDNTNTKRALLCFFGPVFVGCNSQRFNIAVKDVIDVHCKVVKNAQRLKKTPSCSVLAALLRLETPLSAKTAIKTRWISTYWMLSRFFKLKNVLEAVNYKEVGVLMLTDVKTAELCSIVSVCSDSILWLLSCEITTPFLSYASHVWWRFLKILFRLGVSNPRKKKHNWGCQFWEFSGQNWVLTRMFIYKGRRVFYETLV